jgi:hypothetical protein
MLKITLAFVLLVSGFAHANNPVLPDSVKEVKTSFENYVDYMYLQVNDSSMNKQSLAEGLRGFYQLKAEGKIKDSSKLTIVDFSKSGNEERLYVIDLFENTLLWKSLVSHGEKTGGLYAKHFSNTTDSHQSSLGFYVTGQRWHDGRLGECLQLYGREYCNYKALTRGIIVHKADYANCEYIEQNGALGRSYGCPAVPEEGYEDFVNLIDEGTCYFIYHPNRNYHRYSKLLNRRDYLIEFGRDFGFLL